MTVLEARRCTVADFDIMIEAKHLRDADDLYMVHRLAWANNLVQATKRNGRPRFPTFDRFFDYEKLVRSIRKGEMVEDKKKVNMAEQNMKLSEFRKKQIAKRKESEKNVTVNDS